MRALTTRLLQFLSSYFFPAASWPEGMVWDIPDPVREPCLEKWWFVRFVPREGRQASISQPGRGHDRSADLALRGDVGLVSLEVGPGGEAAAESHHPGAGLYWWPGLLLHPGMDLLL